MGGFPSLQFVLGLNLSADEFVWLHLANRRSKIDRSKPAGRPVVADNVDPLIQHRPGKYKFINPFTHGDALNSPTTAFKMIF